MGAMSEPVTWGDVLRERRSQLGLTQKQLAAAAGVVEKTITNTETGGMTPKPRNLQAICDALGITADLPLAVAETVSQRKGLAAVPSVTSIYVTELDDIEAEEPVSRGFMEARLAELDARIARLERAALRRAGGVPGLSVVPDTDDSQEPAASTEDDDEDDRGEFPEG